MKTLQILVLVVLSLIAVLVVVARHTAVPAPLPAGSASAQALQPGPHAVGFQHVTLTDRKRPTAANPPHPARDSRTLETNVWFPLDAAGTAVAEGHHPLVIHSHGFSSNREEGRYLARHLASLGYIVMSADFPLTHMRTPGGPQLADVVNQPGDVSFLIDTALGWNRAVGHMFFQRVDADRIATMGVSLGGMTSTLAAFHGRLRDPRLKAVISIAGPSVMFGPEYFRQAAVPFLMIAGDIDAIVPYERNAAPIPAKYAGATLLTLQGGSHTGFADAARWLRWMGNPDALGCAVVKHRKPEENPVDFYASLGDGSSGIIEDRRNDFCTLEPLPLAMNALHQQRLTLLAVTAFLQSQLAGTAQARTSAREFLLSTLPAEQADVRVTTGG